MVILSVRQRYPAEEVVKEGVTFVVGWIRLPLANNVEGNLK